MNKKSTYLVGIIFLIIGIYLSIFKEEPHFYSFFSIGLVLILANVYNSISKKPIFHKWKVNNYLLFFVSLIITSIIMDRLGLNLGYWKYQYITIFDESIKYIFEWSIALVYLMLTLMVGMKISMKKFNEKKSFIISLFIFVTLMGLFTEFINHFSNSWIILKMPFTNYKIGEFYVIFQTIGYWLMAVIPLIIFKTIKKIK